MLKGIILYAVRTIIQTKVSLNACFLGKAVSNSRLVCMLLNGKQLLWVNNAKFIGIILNTNHDNQDMVVKRGIAIAKINSVLQ